MTNFLIDTPDLFELEPLSLDAIELTDQQVQQALQASQQAPLAQQWAVYLETLAQTGLQTWLSDRGLQPSPATSRLATNSALQIQGFRVQSLAMTSVDEETVTVPEVLLTDPAHFYVLVQVMEEQNQAWVTGFIAQTDLQAQLAGQTADATGSYELALAACDREPGHLLLNLRCADPAMFPLASPASVSQSVLQSVPQRVTEAAQDAAQSVSRSVMNVGRWLQGQLDQVAEELAWVLLPPNALATAGAMRSGETSALELARLLQSLERQGTQIPVDARGGYQDLSLSDSPLRLYAITGTVEGPEPEWSLLVVLGAQADRLPAGVTLQISDPTGILVEQTFDPASQDAYLFAQVIGTYEEAFTVSIGLPNGQVETLPQFAFQP